MASFLFVAPARLLTLDLVALALWLTLGLVALALWLALGLALGLWLTLGLSLGLWLMLGLALGLWLMLGLVVLGLWLMFCLVAVALVLKLSLLSLHRLVAVAARELGDVEVVELDVFLHGEAGLELLHADMAHPVVLAVEGEELVDAGQSRQQRRLQAVSGRCA